MRLIKRFMLCLVIIAFFIPSYQVEAMSLLSKTVDYSVLSYDIHISVNDDKTYRVIETIEINFTRPTSDFHLKIPLRQKVKGQDGANNIYHSKVTDVLTSTTYKRIGYSSDGLLIYFNERDTIINGYNKFVLSYTVNTMNDSRKDSNELFNNLLGRRWRTDVANATFTIDLPSNLNPDQIHYSFLGEQGDIDNSNISFSNNGKRIAGNYNGILHKNENFAVKIGLPEGYFTRRVDHKDLYIQLLLCIGYASLGLMIWLRHGKKSYPVIDIVEFKPPYNLSSFEVGFFYKGYANEEDVLSLILYAAGEGYLSINQGQLKYFAKDKSNFYITKTREYDGEDNFIRSFLDIIFSKGNSITSDELKNMYNEQLYEIMYGINTKENMNRQYETSAIGKKKYVMFTMILIYFTAFLPCFYNFQTLLFMRIIGFILPLMLLSEIVFIYRFLKNGRGILRTLVRCVCYIGLMLYLTFPALIINYVAVFTYVLAFIIIVILGYMFYFMPKRNRKTNDFYGKIMGYKKFLNAVEKSKIEALVDKEPQLFYTVLSYAYVLGITKKWMKRFENIMIPLPKTGK